jgi:hypothetical protein
MLHPSSSILDAFGRKHPVLTAIVTLMAAVLATAALLSQSGAAATAILYEGF